MEGLEVTSIETRSNSQPEQGGVIKNKDNELLIA